MKQNPDTNDRRLEALFGEALGDKPSAQETEAAWQQFRMRHSSHQRRNRIYGVAASVAAVIVLTVLLWRTPDKDEAQPIQVFASLQAPEEVTFGEAGGRKTVSTPAGTTTSLTLSDGTEVLLSANSRLEYDKTFAADRREVTLVGEARFSVAKDASRPFIVHTEQLQTQVHGTVFDVTAYPQSTPDVTLYEGKVEVSLNGRENRMMRPGEQAFVSEEGHLQLTTASTDQGKWAEGEFAFDNRELRAVMQEIGSWYNISVVFHSRPLLEERIYFRTPRTPQVEEVLAVLNDMGIAKFELKEGEIVVTSK